MNRLFNPMRPDWNAHSHQVKKMLGLDPKARLPKEGMPPKQIQGFLVWVKPLTHDRKATREHRVIARCLTCNWEGSAGRTHQHKCKE